ncbi:MAG: DNA translocase FtsK 4TM domain-containing protein, partial [Terriglobia bacterium]
MQPASSSQTNRSRDSRAAPPLLDLRRRSELLGFLLAVVALLIALSLGSYHHLDPSLDTATSLAGVRNWVGVAGSYSADALLQIFGWTAFLIPLALFIVGGFLFLVRPLHSRGAKALGAVLLIVSVAALLQMTPQVPRVFGIIQGSGVIGTLVAAGLINVFNATGAMIVAGAAFLSSLFLVTKFSFSGAGRVTRSVSRYAFGPSVRRWSSWRAARQHKRAQQRAERERERAKEAVVARRLRSKAAEEKMASNRLPVTPAPLPEAAEDDSPDEAASESLVVLSGGRDTGEDGEEPAPAPKVNRKKGLRYKLPSPSLLRPPDDRERVDEDELKQRAQQLMSKFAEFGVTGMVTQIHPGPV